MTLKNLTYRHKWALAGGLVGLFGSILRPFFLTMNNDPFFIFGIPGISLQIAGFGGCNWKSSFCPAADSFGYIITIMIFSLLGMLLGSIIRKMQFK